MKEETPVQLSLPDEQLNLIESNLKLTIDERIAQLQSAVELIEEMRTSLKETNENRLQKTHQ